MVGKQRWSNSAAHLCAPADVPAFGVYSLIALRNSARLSLSVVELAALTKTGFASYSSRVFSSG